MRGPWVRVVLLAAWLAAAWAAKGAGLRDIPDAWLIDWPEARSILGRKSAAAGTGWWVQAGTGRLFELAELDQRRLEAGLALARGRLGLGAGWEVLGRDLYREDQVEAWLRFGRVWSVTLRFRQERRAVAGFPATVHRSAGLDLGGPLVRGDGLTVRGELRLWRQDLDPARRDVPRHSLARLTLCGRSLGLAAVLDRDRTGAPGLGLDLMVRLSGRLGVSLRVDPATGTVGPGFTCLVGRLHLRTSHVVHPFLGTSHRMVVGVGRPAGRQW